jgi:hypothetical protein
MTDTTYIFGQDINNYVPFNSSGSDNEDCIDRDKDDKFCPICHYNLKSAEHRKLCGNTIPIGDCNSILFLLLLVYTTTKLLSKWQSTNVNGRLR